VHDDLLVWIAELRDRLDRGEFDGLDSIDFGDGHGLLPAERTVRIMLNDLDELEAFDQRKRGNGHPPSDDEVEFYRIRRFELLAAFLRLRATID
jgi:hypothetical protein